MRSLILAMPVSPLRTRRAAAESSLPSITRMPRAMARSSSTSSFGDVNPYRFHSPRASAAARTLFGFGPILVLVLAQFGELGQVIHQRLQVLLRRGLLQLVVVR